MAYEITDDMFGRTVVRPGDAEAAGMEWPYAVGDDVGPKFDNVGACVAWHWSLDSGQDESCGTSEFGNGWHALFTLERVIIQTTSQGFVFGWRVPDDVDLAEAWARIEEGAVYPDDPEEDE